MKWLRKYTGWIAAAAVAGMVVWLATTAVTLNTAQEAAPGKLFGRPVSAHDYRRAVEAATHDAMLRFGDRYRQQLSDAQLQQQAWERLILLTEARQKKIRVSDKEVVAEIQRTPAFQHSDGRFDRQGYETVMRYGLGTTARAFEEEVREELAIRKLLDQSVGHPTLTEEEILAGFRRREEQIRLRLITLPRQLLAREIADAARTDPDQLDSAARQLRLAPRKTDLFKRNNAVLDLGPAGIGFDPLFGLNPGEVGPAVPTQKGWVVAQLLEKKTADDSQLPAVRKELEKELLDQKRLQSYLTWYRELVQRATQS